MSETTLTTHSQPIRSFMVLRRTIGIIVLALVPTVYFIGSVLNGRWIPEKSISAYYHTTAHDVFVISLFTVGTFLWFYKGYEGQGDNWAGNVAGVAVMVVAIVPTFPENSSTGCWAAFFTWQADVYCLQTVSRIVHHIAAVIFFVMLAVFCLYFFTKSRQPTSKIDKKKRHRNRIYRTCGYIIVAVIAILTVISICQQYMAATFSHPLLDYAVLIGEIIAILAFGISWLVKGNAVDALFETEHNTTD